MKTKSKWLLAEKSLMEISSWQQRRNDKYRIVEKSDRWVPDRYNVADTEGIHITSASHVSTGTIGKGKRVELESKLRRE